MTTRGGVSVLVQNVKLLVECSENEHFLFRRLWNSMCAAVIENCGN